MALSLSSISVDTAVRAPRILLLGTEKIGKTTFAASAPNPIFLSIRGEQGTDGLGVSKFPTIDTFTMLMEAIGVLAQDNHKYQTVVIDSVSTLETLIWQHVCKLDGKETIERVLGGFHKGYGEALKYWRDMTDGLDYLREHKGMSSILIGHVKVKPFNDPLSEPYDTYIPTLNDKASAALMQWADTILFANSKVSVQKMEDVGTGRAKQIAERKLFTQKRPAHPGGGRHVYGRIPYEIELSYDAFTKAVETATSN